MSKYYNLNIKIDLAGDIKKTIPIYNYSVNSDPTSKFSKIYIPKNRLIGDINKNKSTLYLKNPEQNFVTIERMEDFLITRSAILKKTSQHLTEEIRSLTQQIKTAKNANTDKNAKAPNTDDIESLESEKDKIIQKINQLNIDTIISLFFKPKSLFYYKDKKYIINKYKIEEYDSKPANINNQELQTRNDLIIKLIEKKEDELSRLQLGLLQRDPTKDTAEEKQKILDESKNAAKKYILEMKKRDLEYMIKKEATLIVVKLNKRAKRNKENTIYEYDETEGIKIKNTSLIIKNITISLNVHNVKNKHMSRINQN